MRVDAARGLALGIDHDGRAARGWSGRGGRGRRLRRGGGGREVVGRGAGDQRAVPVHHRLPGQRVHAVQRAAVVGHHRAVRRDGVAVDRDLVDDQVAVLAVDVGVVVELHLHLVRGVGRDVGLEGVVLGRGADRALADLLAVDQHVEVRVDAARGLALGVDHDGRAARGGSRRGGRGARLRRSRRGSRGARRLGVVHADIVDVERLGRAVRLPDPAGAARRLVDQHVHRLVEVGRRVDRVDRLVVEVPGNLVGLPVHPVGVEAFGQVRQVVVELLRHLVTAGIRVHGGDVLVGPPGGEFHDVQLGRRHLVHRHQPERRPVARPARQVGTDLVVAVLALKRPHAGDDAAGVVLTGRQPRRRRRGDGQHAVVHAERVDPSGRSRGAGVLGIDVVGLLTVDHGVGAPVIRRLPHVGLAVGIERIEFVGKKELPSHLFTPRYLKDLVSRSMARI